MEEEKISWLERLQYQYRLLVLDDETLQEIKVVRWSLGTIIGAILSILLLVVVLTTLAIWYTPLRRMVPGYGDIKENREFIQLSNELEDLKTMLASQETYTAGLMKMLSEGKIDPNFPLERVKVDRESTAGDSVEQSSGSHTSPMLSHDDNDFSLVKNLPVSDIESNKTVKSLDPLLFVPPIYGSVSAKFDPSIQHYGVDISGQRNSPIKTISHGIVISSDWTLEHGNMIMIQHDDNLISVYKHNSALLKRIGDVVKAGEAIAIIGNTGTLSTGPHLHFEMWYQGKPINPQAVINFTS